MNITYLIFNFILSVLEIIITIILAPINLLLIPFIPDVSNINIAIDNMFSFLDNAVQFILGWLHLPDIVYTLLGGYVAFLLIYIPVSIAFKFSIKYYRAFKG